MWKKCTARVKHVVPKKVITLNIKLHIANLLFRYDVWRASKDKAPPPGLRIYVFHSLFENEAERDSGLVFPHEGITLAQFEEFVRLSIEHGIRIVGPEALGKGFDEKKGPAILISFDDGYANNLRALPVLERYEVPALFCVVTRNILEQRSFWWDLVGQRQNAEGNRLLEERKRFLPEENEAWLMRKFGEEILNPATDIGRPMTIEELKSFAAHPLVHIGNHSHSHPLFTQIGEERMKEEMATSQNLLKSWLGESPSVMAWPNGSYSKEAEDLVAKYGVSYALSTERRWFDPGKDLPFSPGRVPLYGVRDIAAQLKVHEHRDSRWW